MHRIALIALLGTAAFGQTDGPTAQKPPAEVDQALRTRVTEFYTMMVKHDYRKAEGWVAADTKDYYYDGAKPDIHKYEILSFQFSDLTHATVMTKCTEAIAVPGFPPGEITVTVPTLWKIENGNWYVYEDPEKIANPTAWQDKVQAAVKEAAAQVAAAPMPKDLPKDPAFALGKLDVDKPEVELAPGTVARVTIGNSSSGPVTLEPGYPLQGVEAKLDRTDVAKGEKATLTLTGGKQPTGGFYYLRVMPTGESIRIQVQVK